MCFFYADELCLNLLPLGDLNLSDDLAQAQCGAVSLMRALNVAYQGSEVEAR